MRAHITHSTRAIRLRHELHTGTHPSTHLKITELNTQTERISMKADHPDIKVVPTSPAASSKYEYIPVREARPVLHASRHCCPTLSLLAGTWATGSESGLAFLGISRVAGLRWVWIHVLIPIRCPHVARVTHIQRCSLGLLQLVIAEAHSTTSTTIRHPISQLALL